MIFRFIFITFLIATFPSEFIAQKSGYFRQTIVRQGRDFSFPIFALDGRKPVAAKINRLLQLSELYLLVKSPYSTRIFDQSKANDGSIYGGKVSLSKTVYSNNDRMLSVGFDQSACGATCGYWNRYYTFNSGNGDRIELKDIFSTDGYRAFFKTLLEKRTLKYRKEVRRKVEPEFHESYMDTLGCFENNDLSDFYIRGKRIVIDGYNCLVKGQKFDGLDMVVAIDLPMFRRHLNSYGKTLFGLQGRDVSKFRSKELPQLFEGAINGSYPIVMVLQHQFERGYQGYYAYLKYGEGIAIKGSEIGDEILLTEYILSPTVTDGPLGEIRKALKNGYVTGRLSGRVFEGVWSDASRTKNLPFSVTAK